jgi:hypothetical protein
MPREITSSTSKSITASAIPARLGRVAEFRLSSVESSRPRQELDRLMANIRAAPQRWQFSELT